MTFYFFRESKSQDYDTWRDKTAIKPNK